MKPAGMVGHPQQQRLLDRIARIVDEDGRVNANVLAQKYSLAYGESLEIRGLGFRKLGALLDVGDGKMWRVDRVPARRNGTKVVESGSLFLTALDYDRDEPSRIAEDDVLVGFYSYSSPRWNEEATVASAAWLHALASMHQLKGRIRIACEGVNATLSGSPQNVQNYLDDLSWPHVDFKIEPCGPDGWRSLQVWRSDEICGLGCDYDEQLRLDRVGPGLRIPPKQFHEAIRDDRARKREGVLLDVRNVYETRIGTFELPQGSRLEKIDLKTRHFSDFKPWVEANAQDLLKGKDVYMFCTGGVRCERASALVKAALEDEEREGENSTRVFHLEGGIVKYMERYKEDASYFKGKNYVFDRRANKQHHPAVTSDIRGRCSVCSVPWDTYRGKRRCSKCRTLLLVCDSCIDSGADHEPGLVLSCEYCV